MSKEATDRYSVKVEIPITVILETIFSTDNNDVETLCRYARKYGFVDFDEKEKVYKLQKDYNKQDFYVWLSKEERKQYEYEDTLLDRIDKAIEYIEKNKENRKGLSVEEYKVKWRSLFDYYESEDIMKDLLNILKGSEE